MHVLVLGGYGTTGRSISRLLLKHSSVELTIAGTNFLKAKAFCSTLLEEFPNRKLFAVYADATHKLSLIESLGSVDLMVIATTTPDYVGTLAQACLETDTDYLDIFIRGDVVDKLDKYRDEIIERGRTFITQAGVHPGLIAPLIKYGANFLNSYDSANVGMAFNAEIEQPAALQELIYEVGHSKTLLFKNKEWKQANYKDAIKFNFTRFGNKVCYPYQSREIYPLIKELGLKNAGAFTAGFNGFVDNLVFPLVMLLQSVKDDFGNKLCSKLMYWGIKMFSKNEPGIEFILRAKGRLNEREQIIDVHLQHDDAYELTSMAIISCINQYLARTHIPIGLHLMGNIVSPAITFKDLSEMGVKISAEQPEEELTRGNMINSEF